MNKKFKKKRGFKLITLRKRCDCGRKVENHHYLCDKCWGIREGQKHRKLLKTLNKNWHKE